MEIPKHRALMPEADTTNKNARNSLGGIAVAGTLATLTLVGIHAYAQHAEQPEHKHETMSDLEAKAQVDAHKTYESLTADDIANYKVTSTRKGPEVLYNGELCPSMLFDVTVTPGSERESKWVQEGGNRQGNYFAEVRWASSVVMTEYTTKKPDGKTEKLASGTTRLADSDGVFDGDGYFDVSPHDAIGTRNQSTRTVVVPFNTSYQGERQATLRLQPTRLSLFETDASEPRTSFKALPDRTLEYDPLATFTVAIKGDEVKISDLKTDRD